MSDDIELLTTQRDTAIQKVGICKANNSTLKASVDELNDKIYLLKVDRKTRVKELNKWKLQARKVRYKVIYKTEEIKSNDCKDVKNTINTIRNLDFSSL